jgi:hypothetical protein
MRRIKALVALVLLGVTLSAQGARETAEPLAISGQVRASFSAWGDSGSALLPPGAAYASGVTAELRAESPVPYGSPDSSRLAFEGEAALDAVAATTAFTLRELLVEWRPLSALSLRAGRQRLGFGSGFAWNPSNDLDPPRSPADPAAPRSGTDAVQLALDCGERSGLPLSFAVEAVPPTYATGVDLGDTRFAAQLYALIGEAELMAVASASRIGEGDFPWLLGGWATAPLGSLVLGLEASARRRTDLFAPAADGSPLPALGVMGACAATATLRFGDFVAVGEACLDQASYSREELARILASPPSRRAAWATSLAPPGSVGLLHFLARLTWSRGDLSASCGAVVDAETGAFSASGEFAAMTGGRATILLRASAPSGITLADVLNPRDDDELGLFGHLASAGASVSIFF